MSATRGTALLGAARAYQSLPFAGHARHSIAFRGTSLKYWFDPAALRRHGITPAEAGEVAGRAAVAATGGALLGYVAGDATDLDAATLAACRRSTWRDRSPDLSLVRAPYALDRAYEAEELMKDNLAASLVVALGVGVLVGYLIRRGTK